MTNEQRIRAVDLLPCPFCGDKPEKRWDDDLDFVHCSNRDCDLYGAEITEEYWNTRAAMQVRENAAHEEAKALVGELLATVHDWLPPEEPYDPHTDKLNHQYRNRLWREACARITKTTKWLEGK